MTRYARPITALKMKRNMQKTSKQRKYNVAQLAKDISPNGFPYEGPYENDRNAVYWKLYTDIIKEVYGVKQVIVGHHLVYQKVETLVDERTGPYPHTFTQEIPSADTLIFDHEVARKLWGKRWRSVLMKLVCVPPSDRDQMLSDLYYGR